MSANNLSSIIEEKGALSRIQAKIYLSNVHTRLSEHIQKENFLEPSEVLNFLKGVNRLITDDAGIEEYRKKIRNMLITVNDSLIQFEEAVSSGEIDFYSTNVDQHFNFSQTVTGNTSSNPSSGVLSFAEVPSISSIVLTNENFLTVPSVVSDALDPIKFDTSNSEGNSYEVSNSKSGVLLSQAGDDGWLNRKQLENNSFQKSNILKKRKAFHLQDKKMQYKHKKENKRNLKTNILAYVKNEISMQNLIKGQNTKNNDFDKGLISTFEGLHVNYLHNVSKTQVSNLRPPLNINKQNSCQIFLSNKNCAQNIDHEIVEVYSDIEYEFNSSKVNTLVSDTQENKKKISEKDIHHHIKGFMKHDAMIEKEKEYLKIPTINECTKRKVTQNVDQTCSKKNIDISTQMPDSHMYSESICSYSIELMNNKMCQGKDAILLQNTKSFVTASPKKHCFNSAIVEATDDSQFIDYDSKMKDSLIPTSSNLIAIDGNIIHKSPTLPNMFDVTYESHRDNLQSGKMQESFQNLDTELKMAKEECTDLWKTLREVFKEAKNDVANIKSDKFLKEIENNDIQFPNGYEHHHIALDTILSEYKMKFSLPSNLCIKKEPLLFDEDNSWSELRSIIRNFQKEI